MLIQRTLAQRSSRGAAPVGWVEFFTRPNTAMPRTMLGLASSTQPTVLRSLMGTLPGRTRQNIVTLLAVRSSKQLGLLVVLSVQT